MSTQTKKIFYLQKRILGFQFSLFCSTPKIPLQNIFMNVFLSKAARPNQNVNKTKLCVQIVWENDSDNLIFTMVSI